MPVSPVPGYTTPSTQFGALPQPGVRANYGRGSRREAPIYASDSFKASVGILAIGTYFHKHLRALLPESAPFALRASRPPKPASQINIATFVWSAVGLSALFGLAMFAHHKLPPGGSSGGVKNNTGTPPAPSAAASAAGSGGGPNILEPAASDIKVEQLASGMSCFVTVPLLSARSQPNAEKLFDAICPQNEQYVLMRGKRVNVTSQEKENIGNTVVKTTSERMKRILAAYEKEKGFNNAAGGGTSTDVLDHFLGTKVTTLGWEINHTNARTASQSKDELRAAQDPTVKSPSTIDLLYGQRVQKHPASARSTLLGADGEPIQADELLHRSEDAAHIYVPEGHYYAIERLPDGKNKGKYQVTNPFSTKDPPEIFDNFDALYNRYHVAGVRIDLS